MNDLAVAYSEIGKVDLAVPLLENVLEVRKSKSGLDHPQTLTSMNNLAQAYSKSGKLNLALPLLEQALKLKKAKLGAEHPSTLVSIINLGVAYQTANKRNLAVPLFAEALKLQKAHGGERPETLATLKEYAPKIRSAGRAEQILGLLEETLKFQKDNFGPEHPDTLTSMDVLARNYQAAGKRELALPLFEQTLKVKKAKLGPDHPSTLVSMNNLALAYHTEGKQGLALPLFEETLRLQKAKPERESTHTLIYLGNLAAAYQTAGRGEMVFPLCEESLKLMKATLGIEHPDTLSLIKNLALSYQNVGRSRDAVPLFAAQSAANPKDTELSLKVAAFQAWFGRDKELAASRQRILAFNADTNEAQRAEHSAEACSIRPAADKADLEATLILARRSVELGKTDAHRPFFQMALGMAEYRSGNFAAAEQALRTAIAGGKSYSKIMGVSPFYLAMSLFKQGKQDEARKQIISAWATMTPLPADAENPLAGNVDHDQLITWMAYKEARSLVKIEQSLVELLEKVRDDEVKKLGADHASTLATTNTLAQAYLNDGRTREAIRLLEKVRDEEVKKLGANHASTLATTKSLAQAYLNNGRTREALPLLAAHSSANPKDTWPALRVAVLQAWFGEDKELATTRQRILAFAEGTIVAGTAERAAKVCSMRPITDRAEREAALMLARRAVELGKTDPWVAWFQMTLGMAEYRNGNFAAADQALLAAATLANGTLCITTTSAFYRAMSLFKQGKQDEARTLMATARTTMKSLPDDDENPLPRAKNAETDPENDLIVWMAYKEAKALIGFDVKPAPAAKPEKMR
jgi:tetratricopeptide (TPR) repeat protein